MVRLILVLALLAGQFDIVRANGALKLTAARMTEEGPVRGIDDGALLSFLGIPYAAPPIGPLRWQAPQQVAPWTDALQAIAPGQACAQNGDLGAFATAGGGEDCLTLNVYAPKPPANPGALLPVLVWIHGGSLLVGQGIDYDPRLLAVQGGAVVVTLNYRLGLLGFFAHPSLLADAQAGVNFGHLDQIAALEWVQRNAAAFGGDKDRVTVAGESSGGGSVLALVVSQLARGKFQRAIVMSGASLVLRPPVFGAARPLADALKAGEDFANAAGCTRQTAECLRALSSEKILALQRPYVSHQTIIDGHFMPGEPGQALKSGHFNRVAITLGTTRDEANFFVGLGEQGNGQPMSAEEAQRAMLHLFGDRLWPSVQAIYPFDAYDHPAQAYAAAATDYMFTCTALKVSQWTSTWTKVQVYEFADRTAPSYLQPTTLALGAAHTLELPYLFSGFHGGQSGIVTVLNDRQRLLSRRMLKAWASTEGAAQENWPDFGGGDPQVLRFELPAPKAVAASRIRREHHCDFWDKTGIY